LWNTQSKSPDDRFIEMMKDYTQTFNNKAASTEDFKAVVEKHMISGMDLEGNRRMDWFFRQYVYGTGVPEYRLQWQAEDSGNGRWKIRGKVLQSGVPSGWLDALPLYIQVAGKVSRLGLMAIKSPDTPFEFDLSFKPEKLILNYLEDTLAIVRD
jgi:aminopeptidase N